MRQIPGGTSTVNGVPYETVVPYIKPDDAHFIATFDPPQIHHMLDTMEEMVEALENLSALAKPHFSDNVQELALARARKALLAAKDILK